MTTTNIETIEGRFQVGAEIHKLTLDTQVIPAHDLKPEDYVLLAPDVAADTIPLLTPADYDQPVLWRVDDPFWEQDVDGFYFVGPTGAVLDAEIFPDDQVRLVLPDQEHQTW